MRGNVHLLLGLSVALISVARSEAQFGMQRQAKAKVSLISEADAITPGQPIDLAVRFELDDDWHIYWQNSGESGKPPRLQWKLPPGFTVGHLQFPVPRTYVSGTGDFQITTNILKGEPLLLVRLTPPDSIEKSTLHLAADVRYLICKDTCILGSTEITLDLPVQKQGTAKPTNEKLFARARRALPKASSKYVSITAVTKPVDPEPGAKFDLLVHVRVNRGLHIQSHTPLSPGLIKCELFANRPGGFFLEQPVYPTPKTRTLPVVGKVSEYTGDFTIRVPIEIDKEAQPGPYTLGGVLRFQACNDTGTCFRPEALAFSMTTGETNMPPASKVQPAIAGHSDSSTGSIDVTESGDGAGDSVAADAGGLEAFLRSLGLPGRLLGCFLFGLLINATPCVLPLLSIKVLGFVQQAHESRAKTMMLGLSFGLGVMIFFVVLGFLAAAGTNILHYPAAVIALGAVVLALALSMLGVYTLRVPTTATKLDASIQQEGYIASFGKGALAPVLGFACTGPFMAGMFGWATQQPSEIALLAFLVTGLGMASPYMVLGANPNWLSFLPKPGHWMITFERIMGFLLLLMVLWLLYPVANRVGAVGLEWTLAFFVFLAMGCWILGMIRVQMSHSRRWGYRTGAALTIIMPGFLIFGWIYPLDHAIELHRLLVGGVGEAYGKIAWKKWSQEALADSVRAGKTVFLDVTSDYCTNCKINKGVAIYREETIAKLEEYGIVSYQADFSDGNDEVFSLLKKFKRLGPPLNVIYPAGHLDRPAVLPISLGLTQLLTALDKAGPSKSTSASAIVP